MSAESFLIRELDIRFIDARRLCSEAKMNLGLMGYTGKDDEKNVIFEALKIFEEQADDVKDAMRHFKNDLDAIKEGNFHGRMQRRTSITLSSSTGSARSNLSSTSSDDSVKKSSGKDRRRLLQFASRSA